MDFFNKSFVLFQIKLAYKKFIFARLNKKKRKAEKYKRRKGKNKNNEYQRTRLSINFFIGICR